LLGESSTLTWKNHIKWYQSRKSNALVWLMRRAARSLRQVERLENAENFLAVLGCQAKALSYLLEVGVKVKVTGSDRYIRFINS
jgi:hypothetical protein